MIKQSKILYPATKAITSVLTLLAICGVMTGCGKKENAEKSGQAIVSVNGEEITFLQLNNELQRANIKPEQKTQAEKEIVKKLIDRQILVQASIKDKLDRNPQVMQAIENAKMQILAQSYLENKLTSIAKPTASDISDYYNSHGDFFANRKVYVMDQIVFGENPNLNSELEALSDRAKTIEEVIAWLNANQIGFAQAKEAHPAESVPTELLDKISKMAIGEIIFFKTNQKIMVSKMVEIVSKPISATDAKPIIERILLAQKRKQFAEAEIARLRSAAEITYLNKKFESSTNDSGVIDTKPSDASKDKATEPSKSAPTQKPTESGKTADHIEKGISGL